jgi:uncharacterized tellurite resistance protein B-like protein
VRILDLVKGHLTERSSLATDKEGAPADLEMRATTAVLLLEAAYGDEEYAWNEERAILDGLERSFGIGHQEAVELVGRAGEIRPPVVSLSDLTDVIVDRYDEDQRMDLLSLLWSVIEADHVVDEWEKVFADHVARAVGLSEAQAREARARASDAG